MRSYNRPLSAFAALGAALFLASCAGNGVTSSSSLPVSGQSAQHGPNGQSALERTGAQSGERGKTGVTRNAAPTELLYVVSPGYLDAYDVSTYAPPAQPYFQIKSKKFGSAPSVAMSGLALFSTSGRATNQSSPIWSPAPTNKKSKITYSCPKAFSTNDAAGATASSSNIYTTQYGTSINKFAFPFTGSKCPKAPTQVLQPVSGSNVLAADPSDNLYYTDGYNNVSKFASGSATPTLVGNTGSINVANMVVDSLGHIIAVDYNTCNLYIFAPVSGTLVLATTYLVPSCSSEFDQGGITLDSTESRIFIGDYVSNTIDVVSYNAATMQASYAYSFPTVYRAWSIAVSPVDTQ